MLSKKMKFVCVAVMLLLKVGLYAQSAETGSPFNQYMSADAGVNPLSGTVSVSKTLASISAGDVQASFTMSYSGNVTQYVNNRNDVSPTGWLGLGWAMGFAKIICEHNSSMSLDDDSYYLLTAEGNRHKIVKPDPQNGNTKWWISGLPYWKIEPEIVKDVNYGNHKYDFIVGWIVTDDSGRKYRYGDFLSKNDMESLGRNDFKNGKLLGNATQYVLCWPDSYGMVGENLGGTPRLYPNVWNLQKMEDLKGSYLKYTYVQKLEALAFNGNKSTAKYTKECYLHQVESSDGDRVEFILKPKGEGAFKDEYLDLLGEREINENDADAFVDPVERFYLDKVKFFGKNNKLLSVVELCYEALSFAPNMKFGKNTVKMKNDSKYVKRILTSVVFTNSNKQVVDKESYEYNMDDSAAEGLNKPPFGMMSAIQGANCGRIEFNYTYLNVNQPSGSNLHSQVVNLSKVSSVGYLEDGTPYIVGFKNDYVSVYVRSFGKWVESKSFYGQENMKYSSKKSEFRIGDKGWFVYVKVDDDERGEFTYSPVVWNGREFENKEIIKDGGVRETVAIGAGFIFKSRIDEPSGGDKYSRITLTIPWSIWGKKYLQEDFIKDDGSNENKFVAEDGCYDRSVIRTYASTNHVAIFYLDTDGGNNGRLRIYTFNHDKSKLVKTYDGIDLDDDNTYAFSENMLFGATEDSNPFGGHKADVFQWYESGNGNNSAHWKHRIWDIDGMQGVPSIEAVGSNYFAVKHDDGDDLTVFYWNGESWSTPYSNKDMVGGDTWDYFYESEWNGCSGNNFFVAREPLQEPIKIPYPVLKAYFLGVKIKIKYFNIWTSTYRGVLLDRYEVRDGNWSNTGARNLRGEKTKTSVLVGNDWYIEKTANKAMVWNGLYWNTEELSGIPWGDNYRSLGGNFFVVENAGNASTIYFKKSDSFTDKFGFYIVTQKVVKDPVLDKVVKFDYNYSDKDIYGRDQTVSFDFVNNSPIIAGYSVQVDGIGVQEKVLCKFDNKNLGLGAGQICEEITKIKDPNDDSNIITNNKKSTYVRYDGEKDNLGWPKSIYQDRILSDVTESNKSKSEVRYGYSLLNGQVSSVKTYLDGKNPDKSAPDKEKSVVYAAEKTQYADMKNVNRLTDVYETKECLGECGTNGKNVVSANVSRYKKENNYYVISDIWSYKKMNKNSVYSFNESSLPVNNPNWEKTTEYLKYENYKAIEVVDKLGIKSAAFYENKVTGALLGKVANAGYEESFLLTGSAVDDSKQDVEHVQNFRDNQYTIVPLICGNATDWYNSHEDNPHCGKIPHDNAIYVNGYRNNPLYYGRFTSNAVLVDAGRGKNLRGFVTPQKKKKYVFSAWIQGKNNSARKAYLHIDNVPVREWNLLGEGKWQPIEWDGELTQNKHSFELKTDNDNSMNVQGVLFIPSNASASITYWNKQWGKPIATVNDRGLGTYSVLDDNGRVVQTFGEDNDGNLVKMSETEYRLSDCRAIPEGTGNLAQLKINGDNVLGIKNGTTIKYVVPNNTDEIDVRWKTEQKDEKVRYAFVKKGEMPEKWESSCCGVLDDATLSLKGALNWQLFVDVYPFDDVYYSVDIEKSTSGWIDHGSPLSIGKKPVFASSSNPNYLFYLDKNSVIASAYSGNTWSEYKGYFDNTQNLLKANSTGAKSYVLTLPYVETDSWLDENTSGSSQWLFNNTTALVCEPTYGQNSSRSSCLSNVGNAGERYDFYRLAINNNAVPYVLYQSSKNILVRKWKENVPVLDENGNEVVDKNGNVLIEEKEMKEGSVEKHLFVKKYDQGSNSWKMVGNTLRIDDKNGKMFIEPDIVSDGEVVDADIIMGNDGYPYVAYIGKISAYEKNISEMESLLNGANEEVVENRKNIASPSFVVVKRLYPSGAVNSSFNTQIWAGLSKLQDNVNVTSMHPEVMGDIVEAPIEGENTPITSARRVKLAKGGNGLYLAVLYQLFPSSNAGSIVEDVLKNKYALSVFKAVNKTETISFDDGSSLKTDGLVFVPLLDQSVSASVYSSSVEEEQRIIAYLDDSDPFDIEIYTDGQGNEYPYLMFANESNYNKLTVIKYNGSRWLSIGKPAFAEALNEKESADLAIDGSTGVPYVVFREDASSSNVHRQNHIVPQKYSSNSDKDLTLKSLGYVAGTTISSEFRQYILNYSAIVSSNVSSITIRPVISNTDHVCSIVVENNEKPVNKWKSDNSSCGSNSWFGFIASPFSNNSTLMDIPLTPGTNNIKIKVYGSNHDFLTYNIVINRDADADDDFTVVADNGDIRETDETVVPTTDGTTIKVYTRISYGDSKRRSVCFQFNAFWTMEYKNHPYYMSSCVDIVFPEECSDSYYEIVKLSDTKGNMRIYKIKDGSCGKNKGNEFIIPFLNSSSSGNNPVYSSSSSSYPGYDLSSSSCGYEGCLTGSSSSSYPGYDLSSSSCGYEGCLTGSSSSSYPGYDLSSSSCTNGSGCAGELSSSSKCTAFVNGTGHYDEKCFNSGLQDMEQGKCYTMNPDRIIENPIWISMVASDTWWWIETPCFEEVVSSSSSYPGYNQSSSSCGYEGCLTGSSSSSNPGYNQSSSSCDFGCSSVSSSSSVSANIPEEYTSLMQYKVFTTGHMNIADRVVLNGGSYGCTSANVGSNANISILLYATGDVELRNNSYTEQVVAGGSVSVQSGAQYGFMFNEPINLPNLAVQNVPYGNEDLIVYGGQTVTVQPGMYKRLHVYAGANVTFVGGVYNFESFNIESDAKLSFNNSVTPIRVWVQNTFSLGDRVEVNTTGTAEDLFIYTNTSSLYLGVISSIRAVLVAPNATANIASRYTWDGQIWAREITIQPDAVVR